MCYGSNYCHVSPWKPPGMLNKSCVNIYQNPAATVDIMKTSPQVVFAVVCYRTLRQPPNLLLLALAVTDLCVSVVVMPGNYETRGVNEGSRTSTVPLLLDKNAF